MMHDLNLFCFILNLAVIVLCGALMAVIPALTRQAFLFGVRVPEAAQADPVAKALKRRYTGLLLGGTGVLAALTVLQFALQPGLSLLASLYAPLLLIFLQFALYLLCWKRSLRLKAERTWQAAETRYAQTGGDAARGRLSAVPWAWYIACGVLCLAFFAYASYRYPLLPDRIPTHYNIHMQPDAWADKSPLPVFIMPVMAAAILGVMIACAVAVVRARLQVSVENPALSFAQHRVYRRWMGHSLGVGSLCMAAGIILGGLPMINDAIHIPFAVVFGLPLAGCVPLVFVAVRTGQGGCKLKPAITEADAAASGYRPANTQPAPVGRSDDANWFLGLFYINRDDPALLVEDRFGSSIGFNYARLPVRIGMIAGALLLAGVYVWMTVILV